MKTREQLDTEISISILEQLHELNAKPEPELSTQQKRLNAMEKLMNANKFQSNQKMRDELAEHYKNR